MSQEKMNTYCQELAELVAACDPDNPNPELLEKIERHVEQCAECQSAESALDRTVRAFREAEPRGVSSQFEQSLVDQLCRKDDRADQA